MSVMLSESTDAQYTQHWWVHGNRIIIILAFNNTTQQISYQQNDQRLFNIIVLGYFYVIVSSDTVTVMV